MANELDELMDKDPLDLTTEDLDAIINYHRRQRLIIAKGEKAEAAVKTKIDLTALGLLPAPTAVDPNFKRRA